MIGGKKELSSIDFINAAIIFIVLSMMSLIIIISIEICLTSEIPMFIIGFITFFISLVPLYIVLNLACDMCGSSNACDSSN